MTLLTFGIFIYPKGLSPQKLYLKFQKNELRDGKKLLLAISELSFKPTIRSKINLPEYKFFTRVLISLLESSRTRGIKIQTQLNEIKNVLIFDLN